MLKTLKTFLSRKLVTVHFYMKSGNVIVADRVEHKFEVTVNGNAVTSVKHWQQHNPRNRMMLLTLDLSQIEAVTFA